MANTEAIRAAGVVLVRQRKGKPEVLAVHRPQRRDWSVPKGKLEPREHPVVGAVRECLEETGYLAALGEPLSTLRYTVQGRPKTVDYWVGRVRHDAGFAPTDEVDEVRWLSAAEAAELLTYEHDREIVAAAVSRPMTTAFILLRHTQAMKRADFSGTSDQQRPLTATGLLDAQSLVPVLDAFGITNVHTSDALRCEQTISPFATWLGRGATREPGLSELGFLADPTAGRQRIGDVYRRDRATVVCTHRPVLPELVDALAGEPGMAAIASDLTSALKPGGMLVIHRSFEGRRPTARSAEVHQWRTS